MNYDLNGNARVLLYDANGNPLGVTAPADGMPNATAVLESNVRQLRYNGASWDRVRNNIDATLLASAARTASANSADQVNYNHRGAMFLLDVTANPGGAETLTLFLKTKTASALDKTFVSFAALPAASNGTYIFVVCPGAVNTLATSSTFVQALALPRSWYARVYHSAGGSWTYTLECSMIA